MAKIDLSLIEGYDKMSAEEKIAALQAFEIPDDSQELKDNVKKYKELVDKYSAEISDMKKAQRAGLSDAERKAKEDEDKYNQLLEKYDTVLREMNISKNKAKYIALGYSEELAEDTATAMEDKDFEKVFANAETYKADIEKKVKASVLKETPHPQGKGTGAKPMTKAEIMAVKDSVERQRLIAENIKLFTERN